MCVWKTYVLDNLNVFLIEDYDYISLYAMIQNGYASWDSVRLLYELDINNMRDRILSSSIIAILLTFPLIFKTNMLHNKVYDIMILLYIFIFYIPWKLEKLYLHVYFEIILIKLHQIPQHMMFKSNSHICNDPQRLSMLIFGKSCMWICQ
jgi:hypothetical protein